MPSPYICSLSLHDALPISGFFSNVVRSAKGMRMRSSSRPLGVTRPFCTKSGSPWKIDSGNSSPRGILIPNSRSRRKTMSRKSIDRKSTRLNSSHLGISYAVALHLLSFPTRRSSDLGVLLERGQVGEGHAHAQLLQALGGDPAVLHEVGVTLEDRLGEQLAARDLDPELALEAEDDVEEVDRSEEHTSELQSLRHLVCRRLTSALFPYTTLFRSRGSSRTWSGRRRACACAAPPGPWG